MNVVHIEQLLYAGEDINRVVYSCMSDRTGELPPHTRIAVVLWYNIVMRILQAPRYMHIELSCNLHDSETHVAYDWTTDQTTPLLQTMYCFLTTNLASYSILQCLFNKSESYIHVNAWTLFKLIRSSGVYFLINLAST